MRSKRFFFFFFKIFPLGDIYNPTLIAWLHSINTIKTNLRKQRHAGVTELLITAHSIGSATEMRDENLSCEPADHREMV